MPTTEGESVPYPHGPPLSQQQHPGLPPHQQRYAPHYAGHPPPPHMQPPPPGPYYGGPPPAPGQYGAPSSAPPHPHQWSGSMPPGPPPPPSPAPSYPAPGQRSLSPDRSSNWNYRSSVPHKPRSKVPKTDKEDDGQYWAHGQPHGPPPPYHNPSYGPPPPGWQGSHPAPPLHSPGPPPPTGPPAPRMGYSSWGGKTPPRRPRDPYSSTPSSSRQHDMDMPQYMGPRGHPSAIDDDCASSSAADSNKDKGRGSYKCGRCGVPKKGHVCPYQPKLKRRPDEPAPDTRNAAVQVEMDEFMTLRRLNIRIQGFPESYATEPYMSEMVVGEPSIPMPLPPPMEMSHISSMMPEVEQRMTVDTINDEQSSRRHANSPMRDAAVGDGRLNHDFGSSPEEDIPV